MVKSIRAYDMKDRRRMRRLLHKKLDDRSNRIKHIHGKPDRQKPKYQEYDEDEYDYED